MALVLNGSGITSANLVNGTIVDEDVADVAASKLTGALPAIDGSALTGMPAGGKVLQVVNVYSNNMITSTSASRISLDTLSLTPVGSGSRFVINWFLQANWGGLYSGFGAYMYRDGVEIAKSGNEHSVYTNTITDNYLGGSWSCIDTSGSTVGTAISFELRAQPYNTSLIRFSGSTQTRGFVIMEIAQ